MNALIRICDYKTYAHGKRESKIQEDFERDPKTRVVRAKEKLSA